MKTLWHGVDHPPLSSAEVKERVEFFKFNIYGSVHRSNLVAINNKMQLGNGVYYSTLD